MTFNPNDPDLIMRERQRRVSHVNYTPWIFGAVAFAALVFVMVFFMSGHHQDTAISTLPSPAATPTGPGPASPTTNGSAVPTAPGAR